MDGPTLRYMHVFKIRERPGKVCEWNMCLYKYAFKQRLVYCVWLYVFYLLPSCMSLWQNTTGDSVCAMTFLKEMRGPSVTTDVVKPINQSINQWLSHSLVYRQLQAPNSSQLSTFSMHYRGQKLRRYTSDLYCVSKAKASEDSLNYWPRTERPQDLFTYFAFNFFFQCLSLMSANHAHHTL